MCQRVSLSGCELRQVAAKPPTRLLSIFVASAISFFAMAGAAQAQTPGTGENCSFPAGDPNVITSKVPAQGGGSNNIIVQCNGNFSEVQTLCKDGNTCGDLKLSNPTVTSASPQDNITFNPSGVPVDVEYRVCNPNAIVTRMNGPNVVTFDNDNANRFTIEGISGTLSLDESAGVVTQIGATPLQTTLSSPPQRSIAVLHTGQTPPNPDREDFGVLRYQVKCTPQVDTGTITIKKESTDGNAYEDPIFDVQLDDTTVAPSNNAAQQGLKINESTTAIQVTAGDHEISEPSLPPGWEFDSIDCGGGESTDNPFTVSVAKDEDVVCTVKNKRQFGKIKIEKETKGGSGEFGFTHDFLSTNPNLPSPFPLETVAADTPVDTGLITVPTGDYSVSETGLATDFALTSATCSSNQQGDQSTPDAISLQNDEEITCRFVNTKDVLTGSLQIIKENIGGQSGDTFEITVSNPQLPDNPVDVTTSDSISGGFKGSTTVPDLPVGTYGVAETGYPAGTSAGDYTTTYDCSGNGSSGSTAIIVNGQTTTCTVRNERKAAVIIRKTTIGGVDTFDFTGPNGNFSITTTTPNTPTSNSDSTFTGLTPNVKYTVAETVPAGWTLQNITGQGCTKVGDSVEVTPGVGESITCTFIDVKDDDDPGEEETKRFIHRRVDNLLTHGPDRARLLRRIQEQKPSLKDPPLKIVETSGSGLQGPAAANGLAHSGTTVEGGMLGYRGVAETGLPWVDAVMGRPEEEPFGMVPLAATGPTSSSSALLSSIAGKLMPLMEGETSFKFGTSLSEIRTNIAEAEARSQQKKLQDAGLSFEGQPYTNPFLGVREGLDFWIEGHITRYRDDIGGISREGDFRILYVGADYVLADGILIGGLVQIDDTEEDIDDPTRTGEIDGTGWMVGPYFGARVLDNLFFDARAAWGQSDNDIWIDDAGGFRTGSFDTERWLATATLTGVHYHGAWRFSPQIGVAYGHESYDTYVNSLGQTIADGEANIGRLNGGGEIAYRIERSSGTIVEPMVSFTGIWNFDSDDLVINGVTEQTDETRAKVEGGVMIRTPAGWALRAAGMYDGLGSDDFEAYGGSLWVNIPIHKPD
jgi:hypothetical protein